MHLKRTYTFFSNLSKIRSVKNGGTVDSWVIDYLENIIMLYVFLA